MPAINLTELENTDYNDIGRLLEQAGLPVTGLYEVDWQFLIGHRRHARLISVAGIERCNGDYLLRSVACDTDWRNQKLGSQLIESLHQKAQAAQIQTIYLLTLDADVWFTAKHGYHVIERSNAPVSITNSTQFSTLCPDDAILMQHKF